jgi:hypothetical protein
MTFETNKVLKPDAVKFKAAPMQKWPKTQTQIKKGKVSKGYMGNPYLKSVGEVIEMSQHQVDEYKKCRKDPIYFLENYAKIVSLDDGIVPFKLFPFQKKLIKAIQGNRKIIGKLFRQAGKSTTLAGFIAWYVLFNANKRAGILANKMMVAQEIFSRVQFIIENTPKWLQQGVKEWNKRSFQLENNSACFACATSPSAVRGLSLNFLFLDEFAHLGAKLAEEFISSVFPTISSSQTSKLVIVSTPKGMNHYYKMWTEAKDNTNGFVWVESHWSEHPKRTQAWADGELASLGKLKYRQEIECAFLGSSATLIDGEKIGTIPHITPIAEPIPFLNQYALPEKGHAYVITVDVSRGVDLDYSTFVVIDISVHPYNVAAVYRCNTVSTLVYPEIIYKTAKWYNDAYVLVETNDLGQQVADILFYDLEYENMYMSTPTKEKIAEGGDAKLVPGLKTTKKSKTIGCDQIKNIVEGDNITINEMAIIHEMSTFARKGVSFAAEEGKNDDLMMCLVIFGYLTNQPIFKDLFDESLREKFVANQIRQVEESFLPIGFFDNGSAASKVDDERHPFGAFKSADGETKSSWDLVWTAVD